MRKALIKLSFILIATSFLSCLEEFDINVARVRPRLVIEGSVSNGNFFTIVSLSSVTSLRGIKYSSTLGLGAHVEIREIGGETVVLSEFGRGFYYTTPDVFKGEIGKSYQLFIRMPSGEEYESSIVTIPEPIRIASGTVTPATTVINNDGIIPLLEGVHEVEIEIENTGYDHFLKIESEGWSEVLIQTGDCTSAPPKPRRCWDFRSKIVPREIVIGNNRGLSSENYTLKAVSVPFEFRTDYIATITAKTMSASSYLFWEQIQEQLNRSGGLFERPIANIQGNLINSNGNKVTLGYFHAYGVDSKSFCFDRSDMRGVFADQPRLADCNQSCLNVWPGAVEERPDLCN